MACVYTGELVLLSCLAHSTVAQIQSRVCMSSCSVQTAAELLLFCCVLASFWPRFWPRSEPVISHLRTQLKCTYHGNISLYSRLWRVLHVNWLRHKWSEPNWRKQGPGPAKQTLPDRRRRLPPPDFQEGPQNAETSTVATGVPPVSQTVHVADKVNAAC